MSFFSKIFKLKGAGEKSNGYPYSIQPFKFNLGDKVICRVTGLEGVVTVKCRWMFNSNTYEVRPIYEADTELKDTVTFEEVELELLKHNYIDYNNSEDSHTGLGDVVKNTINGFVGVVTATAYYHTGCMHCGVMPKKRGMDGRPSPTIFMSERSLEVVAPNPFKPKEESPEVPGGPVESCTAVFR